MEPQPNLGSILRSARELHGLSMQDVGDQVGVNRTSVLRFETNARRPSPETLQVLAHALRLSASDLFAIGKYAMPQDLPTLRPYLRAKYGLDEPAIQEIQDYVTQVASHYGNVEAGLLHDDDETGWNN